ncbi:TPA: type I toxin-antitoxin system Ibs family toxin [Escherichia coli]|nr:type I toxin-antitoxin system Ibs family toxin [Escherichia coli]
MMRLAIIPIVLLLISFPAY